MERSRSVKDSSATTTGKDCLAISPLQVLSTQVLLGSSKAIHTGKGEDTLSCRRLAVGSGSPSDPESSRNDASLSPRFF